MKKRKKLTVPLTMMDSVSMNLGETERKAVSDYNRAFQSGEGVQDALAAMHVAKFANSAALRHSQGNDNAPVLIDSHMEGARDQMIDFIENAWRG